MLFRYPDTVPPVVYIGRYHGTVGDPAGMRLHSHPKGLEIFCVERGDVEWWTGSQVHDLHPNDALVSLPRVSHGTVDSSLSPCVYVWVHLDPAQLPDELRQATLGRHFAGVHRGVPEIVDTAVALLQEHRSRDAYSANTCRALAELLAVAVARAAGRIRTAGPSELVKLAQQAFLDEGSDPVSVADVAESLSVSSVWLTRKFRQEVGETPAAWVRAHKIAEAKRLLSLGEMPVGDIAFHLGFPSSQYFATAFRRETGRTPSEYRSLHPNAKRSSSTRRR